MVPLILAGATLARMVATPIARKLIREGVAKEASKTAAKKIIEKPITNINQLPKNLRPPTTTPSSKGSPVRSRPGARTQKQNKELRDRTQKAKDQAREAAPKSKTKTSSVPIKIRRGVLEQLKIDRELAFQAAQKLRGAEQARGSVRIVPRNQKGMSLPGKGGTVKRSRGGPVNARSRAAIRGFRKEQRGG